MSADMMVVADRSTNPCPAVDADGTVSYFARLTGTDRETAGYWVSTVDRVAHRNVHRRLTVEGCPGCAFEQSVTA
ncbi:hypothetical protein [Actinoplanes sp. URMC 104]|uniref:hypothetical protein n=1 Tax=Actinoplanes sp. URMC 104 TaxID=3423409 RepID=UPI003F1D09E2